MCINKGYLYQPVVRKLCTDRHDDARRTKHGCLRFCGDMVNEPKVYIIHGNAYSIVIVMTAVFIDSYVMMSSHLYGTCRHCFYGTYGTKYSSNKIQSDPLNSLLKYAEIL